MSGTWTVCRRELGAHLVSPSVWAALALFVLVLHALFFFLGHPVGDLNLPSFWQGREASLRALFAWLPLALVALAPALTMSSWAEERRSGTEELLFSAPLRVRELVLGKFLAAWLVVSCVQAVVVLPLAFVVSRLGPLDWGSVLGGLGGAVLLSSSFVAVGLAASALTREQLSAFATGATVLGALWAAGIFVRALPGALARSAAEWSPVTHFLETAAVGVFDARDIVYHVLVGALFLTVNGVVVESRRWSGR